MYRWSNRANVSWTLTQRPFEANKFIVGTDCPYYKDGHTVATLNLSNEGKVVSISGPWNEIYGKVSSSLNQIAEPQPVAAALASEESNYDDESLDSKLNRVLAELASQR